ncbi:hypothetical protein RRG08_054581 [Elysia crispata]|uniref:Uncharacterized protein n=1 Tax=Elysia crispata TaxID=231223 RepID=A0AAE1E7Z0_9GAST|nr:hypothetical protein RRG08_054581 [Elysia crispata]
MSEPATTLANARGIKEATIVASYLKLFDIRLWNNAECTDVTKMEDVSSIISLSMKRIGKSFSKVDSLTKEGSLSGRQSWRKRSRGYGDNFHFVVSMNAGHHSLIPSKSIIECMEINFNVRLQLLKMVKLGPYGWKLSHV